MKSVILDNYKAFTIAVFYKEKTRDLEAFDIGRNKKVLKAEARLWPNKSFGRTELIIFEGKNVREVKAQVRAYWEKIRGLKWNTYY